MTALAMIIGMVPMALGFGRRRRAERPAGPGRHRGPAVRTVATLFFVPCVFTIFHGRREARAFPKGPRGLNQ